MNISPAKKHKSIEIIFHNISLRKLLEHHSIAEIKQIGFQLMDYGLDAMEERVKNHDGRQIMKIKDSDIFW